MVVTSGYYFETDLRNYAADVWTASVQAGAKGLTADERYTVSVFEHDHEQVSYLRGVVSEVEGEATYWPSPQRPPGMTAALDSVTVTRVNADPDCQD